jgi:hypothetical protein
VGLQDWRTVISIVPASGSQILSLQETIVLDSILGSVSSEQNIASSGVNTGQFPRAFVLESYQDVPRNPQETLRKRLGPRKTRADYDLKLCFPKRNGDSGWGLCQFALRVLRRRLRPSVGITGGNCMQLGVG